jgi:hypothetical protein
MGNSLMSILESVKMGTLISPMKLVKILLALQMETTTSLPIALMTAQLHITDVMKEILLSNNLAL